MKVLMLFVLLLFANLNSYLSYQNDANGTVPIPYNIHLPIIQKAVIPTATPTLTPTATVMPTSTPIPTPTLITSIVCNMDFYNCSAFTTQNEAQYVFQFCLDIVGFDVHELDRDHDNIACESLP